MPLHVSLEKLSVGLLPDVMNFMPELILCATIVVLLLARLFRAAGRLHMGSFALVGVIYDRAHHRNLDNFRGLYEPMPLYGGISAIIFFAAMGLPGMCGFVGEFMVVLATWDYSKTYAVLAALTVVITAAYILWTLQRVFLGTNPAYKAYPDINLRELLCVEPLVVLSILLGVAPNLLLSWMAPSVTGLVKALGQLTQ